MRPKLIRNCYNQNCNMQQQQHLLPAGTGSGSIRSIYSFSSSSASIISTSITITPSPNKFKFNYTRPAAAASSSSSSSSSSSNSNKHQHQPNLLHFDDYYNNNNGTTTSTKSSSDTNALNFETTSNPLSLNNHDDASALASASASPRMITKRQTMNRSSILAKQVIAIHSANTLGFVSQLWLHTSSWLVSVVELRPNLLSGQAQPFLLQDIHQVGDVVLVQDESVTENEISMVGLETLVGYDVVTPGRKKIGKVRGYTFNVNTGAVVSLELDSFGISIIPSSLVSTYALFVEDVLEVVSDTVIVHEAAASRIQRLTKGFWDAQKAMKSMDEFGGFSDLENPVQPEYSWRKRRSSTSESLQSEVGEIDVDWELPMDYL